MICILNFIYSHMRLITRLLYSAMILVALAGACLFVAFTYVNENRCSLANAKQIEGYYIFTDSEPLNSYEYLGTIKGQIASLSSQYTQVRSKLIKRAKNEFPKANGIILHLNAGGVDKADIILCE